MNPKWKGTPIETLEISITDAGEVSAVALGLDLVGRMYLAAPDSVKEDFFRERWMALLSGSTSTLDRVKAGMDLDAWEWTWEDDIAAFMMQRKPYLIY